MTMTMKRMSFRPPPVFRMTGVIPVILLLSFTFNPLTVSGKIVDHLEPITTQVQAVLGNIAELPCDWSGVVGDKIRLVLWSRNNTVIYSLDVRDKLVDDAQHWFNEQLLGGRAFFRTTENPPSLIIENVKEEDAGVYKCRLDFKHSPTNYRNVNLTVIIPPQKVAVVDERGELLNSLNSLTIGPYNEGASLRLTCVSTGGWPIPRVSWWRENALLDDSWEMTSSEMMTTSSSAIVSNTLTIEKLERTDLLARLTCQASNSNISVPVSTTVVTDMSFRPLEVRLLESRMPLSADTTYSLKCQSSGARPPALITWWKGTSKLKTHKEVTSSDGNLTTSTLSFTPTTEDSGQYLSCRAENPLIHGSAIEDGWSMNIHYVPQATLDLGSTLNSTQIREGADVYFECSIKANPWITKVSWRHNGRLLSHNASAGIIITNQSLVLQVLSKKSQGLYTCVGSNKEGDGHSNAVNLDVKYAPVCSQNQQTVYGIARQEGAKIHCDVDSNPGTDLVFRWKFNNSAETIDIQQSHYTVDRSRSTLTYTPITELDYGTVLCWASNPLVGSQKSPCVFHIIPAGKPDGVTNCTIVNQTFDSLFVSCLEGFNGGLHQNFVIEILDFHSHSVIRNLTSSRPIFNVDGLDSGSSFIVRVYAANAKGRSDTQVLQASTLKAAEKQTLMNANASSHLKPAFLQNAPIFAILIGVLATLILVAVVIVIVLRSRGHSGEDKRVPKNNGVKQKSANEQDNVTVPLKKSLDDMLDGDDKNPDVVPHSSEIDGIDPDEKIFLERLNNSSRFYETIPRAVRTVANRPESSASGTSTELVNNVKNRTPRLGREEVTYAELSLPNSPAYPHIHQSTLRHSIRPHPPPHSTPSQEPIIYAQIDQLKTAAAHGSCSGSPGGNSHVMPMIGVSEQQTQTVGTYPMPIGHPLGAHQSSSEVEDFIRLRPENVHAAYTNMRF